MTDPNATMTREEARGTRVQRLARVEALCSVRHVTLPTKEG